MYMEEDVKRGMALLDEKRPDWRKYVELAALDMNEPAQCILGQVYGNYYDGRDELALDSLTVMDYGFFSRGISDSWYDLTDTWVALLTESQRDEVAV